MEAPAPPPPPVVIRTAAAAEKRACRMLLPQSTGAAQRSRLYVAVGGGDSGPIVGALAMGLDRRGEMREGWRVDLRVIVPFRRRGIGRALMEHAVGQALAHGVPALYAWEWVLPDSDAA